MAFTVYDDFPRTRAVCTRQLRARPLVVMLSASLVGASRMVKTIGSLPTAGMRSGVTVALSRSLAATMSVALRAMCKQALPVQHWCKLWLYYYPSEPILPSRFVVGC